MGAKVSILRNQAVLIICAQLTSPVADIYIPMRLARCAARIFQKRDAIFAEAERISAALSSLRLRLIVVRTAWLSGFITKR